MPDPAPPPDAPRPDLKEVRANLVQHVMNHHFNLLGSVLAYALRLEREAAKPKRCDVCGHSSSRMPYGK